MKKSLLLGLVVMALVAGITALPAAAVTLYDGFKVDFGTPDVDPAKWTVTGTPYVNTTGTGHLGLQVGPEAVASKATFCPPAFALARLFFDLHIPVGFGDDQRFGFNLNSLPVSSGGTAAGVGAFFSTASTGELNALVYNAGSQVFKEEVIAAGDASNNWHILKIAWVSADKVEFYVDGELKADYIVPTDGAITVPGPATVDFYGDFDEDGGMAVDWVLATSRDVKLTDDEFDGATGILYHLDGTDDFQDTNSNARITEFAQLGGLFYSKTIHTKSTDQQPIPVFVLNEMTTTTEFSSGHSFFTTPKNKTSADYEEGSLDDELFGHEAYLHHVVLDPGGLFNGKETVHVDMPFELDDGTDYLLRVNIVVNDKYPL